MHTEKIDFETRQSIVNRVMFEIMEMKGLDVPENVYIEIANVLNKTLEEVNNEKG